MNSLKKLWTKLTGKSTKTYAPWHGFFTVGVQTEQRWEVLVGTYNPWFAWRVYRQLKKHFYPTASKSLYARWHPWMAATRVLHTPPKGAPYA